MAWTSPRTWVAGEVPTATILNTHVRDNFKAVGDAWTAYTPTWTAVTANPAIGNGTLTGAYAAAGKLTFFKITLVSGSTTTYGTGNWIFSLPVTALSFGVNATGSLGLAALHDTSASARAFRQLYQNSTTTVQIVDQAAAGVGPTVPWTWANGDSLSIQGFYEAA